MVTFGKIAAIRDYQERTWVEISEEDEKTVTIDEAHEAGEWAFMQGTFQLKGVIYP